MQQCVTALKHNTSWAETTYNLIENTQKGVPDAPESIFDDEVDKNICINETSNYARFRF